MFARTRVKLTAWYLLIIMMISLIFSMIIYSMVNVEFVRFERAQISFQKDIDDFFSPPAGSPPLKGKVLLEDIHEARIRLISRLAIMNLGILIFAGGAGYFLAGRTLKPIKESMDEQNRFISDSSHELRTPLTSLRSEIEVALMNKNLTSKNAREVLRSNLDEVISLQTLSDGLLVLAQNGEVVSKNIMEEISIKESLNLAIKKTESLAKAKEININKKIKDAKVMGIHDRLTEVFVILIDNAIKYSKTKSVVEVSSRKTKDGVKIEIIDFGIGINEKDLPHIFDRFYRAEKSRTENGFGLGLSIAKKIIDLHHGDISVKSEIKKGTTFIITLPQNS